MSHAFASMEKEALNPFLAGLLGTAKKQIGNAGTAALNFGRRNVPKMLDAGDAAAAAVRNSPTAQAFGKGVSNMAGRAADSLKPVLTPVGRVGQFTTNTARNALDVGDDVFQNLKWRMTQKGKPTGTGPFGRNTAPAPTRMGPGGYGPEIAGFGARNIDVADANPMNFRNLGVGAGTIAGVGHYGLGIGGGGGSAAPAAAGAMAPSVTDVGPGNAGGGGFLSGIPKEMQYAAAAGIPLALLGAYHGGGLGMGMGALGLGALGLGAAGSGYFGDDARRMVGQGANSLMSFFGGGKDGDILGQINQLSSLSPEFGVTMLMGRNPGMSREEALQMYQFLTQNKDTIAKMLPQVTGAQTPVVKSGAAMAVGMQLDKMARCWKGYEPVPGKKPYTDGSCRPAGSKKKKEKKAAEKEALNPLLAGGAKMLGRAVTQGIPTMARGMVQGAGKAVSGAGNMAQTAGRAVGNVGQRMGRIGEHVMSHAGQTAVHTARNPLERFTANAVGTAGGVAGMTGNVMQGMGAAARGVGTAANMAGRGIQMAGQHSATAMPLAAAGAYGAYQAAKPMLPGVQFRSPIADPGRAPTFQSPVAFGNQTGRQVAMLDDE